MKKFDMDEQNIYDIFSQIDVDSSDIVEQVKDRLHTEPLQITRKSSKGWTRPIAIAAMLSVALVVTATAAALGNFDWLMEKINPSFGNIVEPVGIHSEDQGIRMEVIGAQKYDNRAIVYLSIQDITGQNRLTEKTEFRDGLSVKTNIWKQGTNSGKDDTIELSSISWRQKMLYFDEDTNTIYYEFNIAADPNTSLADPLELGSFLIYFNERNYKDEPISISLMEIEVGETTSIEKSQIWGGSDIPEDRSLLTKVLTPGYYDDMPHGEKDQWISNIGIVDGKLHIQTGKIFNKEFGSNDATLFLKDSQGNLISYDYTLVFLGDEDNHLIDIEKKDYSDAAYKYEEFVFSIEPKDLKEYTLCYTGSVYSGVEGRWNVVANLEDSSENMHIWEEDIFIGDNLFEHITLSPLGVQVIGTYEGEKCMVMDMSLDVETLDGVISLENGGGSVNSEEHIFNTSWDTNEPLDITKVKAILVDGLRIPVR